MRYLKCCIIACLIHASFGLRASEYPLHDAAYHGNVEGVKQLLRIQNNINQLDNHGRTPLNSALAGIHDNLVASDEGHKQVILELLQVPNIQVNVHADMFLETPLHMAVKYTKSDMTDIIRTLIHKGANPNIQDIQRKTPLHTAVDCNNLSAVRELLGAPGIRFDVTDIMGMTPLQRAVWLHKKDMVHELAKVPGMRFDNIDNYGRTALAAAIWWEQEDIIRELAKTPGMRFDIGDKDNKTPLDLALFKLHSNEYSPEKHALWEDIVKLLQQEEVRSRARQQSRSEALPLFYALKERTGAQSPAKTSAPEIIRQIQQMLEQEKIREAVGK